LVENYMLTMNSLAYYVMLMADAAAAAAAAEKSGPAPGIPPKPAA
jgi:hypothetical protein